MCFAVCRGVALRGIDARPVLLAEEHVVWSGREAADKILADNDLVSLERNRDKRHFLRELLVERAHVAALACREKRALHVGAAVSAEVQAAARHEERTQVEVRHQPRFAVVEVKRAFLDALDTGRVIRLLDRDADALDGVPRGGELLGGRGVGALHLYGLGLVVGIGIGHAGHVEQCRFDGGVAMAAHEAGSLDCVSHGYSSLLSRLSQAPDLDLQAIARVPKYASLLFQVNLGHLENPF